MEKVLISELWYGLIYLLVTIHTVCNSQRSRFCRNACQSSTSLILPKDQSAIFQRSLANNSFNIPYESGRTIGAMFPNKLHFPSILAIAHPNGFADVDVIIKFWECTLNPYGHKSRGQLKSL